MVKTLSMQIDREKRKEGDREGEREAREAVNESRVVRAGADESKGGRELGGAVQCCWCRHSLKGDDRRAISTTLANFTFISSC